MYPLSQLGSVYSNTTHPAPHELTQLGVLSVHIEGLEVVVGLGLFVREYVGYGLAVGTGGNVGNGGYVGTLLFGLRVVVVGLELSDGLILKVEEQ